MILALPLFCYPLASATAVADSCRKTLFVLLMMYGSAQHLWLLPGPRRRLDPRRVSSNVSLARKKYARENVIITKWSGNVLCLFHKIYG